MSAQAVDWFRLLWDLIQRGWTVVEVGRRSQIPEGTLRGYMEGSQPPHWRGELLIVLWCQACDKRREDVPMCDVYTAPRIVKPREAVRVDVDALKALERGVR